MANVVNVALSPQDHRSSLPSPHPVGLVLCGAGWWATSFYTHTLRLLLRHGTKEPLLLFSPFSVGLSIKLAFICKHEMKSIPWKKALPATRKGCFISLLTLLF